MLKRNALIRLKQIRLLLTMGPTALNWKKVSMLDVVRRSQKMTEAAHSSHVQSTLHSRIAMPTTMVKLSLKGQFKMQLIWLENVWINFPPLALPQQSEYSNMKKKTVTTLMLKASQALEQSCTQPTSPQGDQTQ